MTQFGSVASHPQSSATAAMSFDAPVVFSADGLKVLSDKRMPTLAMCLPSVDSNRPIPSHTVYDRGNKFQMGWIHANADTAEMVRPQARDDGADAKFVGESSGRMTFAFEMEMSVPVRVWGIKPQPTWPQVRTERRQWPPLVDLLPESFFRGQKTLMVGVESHTAHTTTHSRKVQGDLA